MIKGVTLKVTVDRQKDFMELVKKFKYDKVLVGIPEATDGRKEVGIGNAAIMFINNFGSAPNNIPPRPVMSNGIFIAQDAIAAEMKNAAKTSIEKPASLWKHYERVGIIASNSIKKVINDQIGIEPPAKSTLAGRQARGFLGTKSLVVTGQLRNSITYVVKAGK